MSPGRIPAPIRILLRVLLPEGEREFFLGDMEEEQRRAGAAGGRSLLWIREIFGALALRLSPGVRTLRTERRKNPWGSEPTRPCSAS
jgi:hypothetical protein